MAGNARGKRRRKAMERRSILPWIRAQSYVIAFLFSNGGGVTKRDEGEPFVFYEFCSFPFWRRLRQKRWAW